MHDPLSLLVHALAGLGLWTVIEYGVHAGLSHRTRTLAARAHKNHHRDPRKVFTAPRLWVPSAALLLALTVALLGGSRGAAVTLGTVVGFLAYEWLHWRIHFRRPRSAWGRRARAHHLAHHTVSPRAYFGVTTRLWDRVFGTLPASWRRDYARAARRPPSRGRSNFRAFYLPWRERGPRS